MGARIQPVPGYYVWEVPGKPVVVHLHLGVVDRLVAEITLGEFARRHKGAVSGVLVGTIERTEPAIVRVEDFEPVESADSFEATCARWQIQESRPTYAVGYF